VGGIDEGLTFDVDTDGFTSIGSCEGSANDCDDNNAQVKPGAAEVCNGIDDNCVGGIDEGLTFDVDTDGFTSIGSCEGSANDCDDNNIAINPGAAEVCNGIDDNCVGGIDEGLTFDVDTDGFTSIGSCLGSANDCDDNNIAINPGAAEACNGIDDNCVDGIDEGLTFDVDTDGFTSIGSCESSADDCDDYNFWINPDSIWYKDADGDSYTDFSTLGPQCIRPNNYLLEIELASLTDPDCNDTNPGINPGATDIPDDGIDQDCDGVDATLLGEEEAFIPAGCFEMGDAFGEGYSEELPVHNICITGFYMDVHEVTNAEYKLCVDAGGCTAPSDNSSLTRTTYYGNAVYDDFPVLYVDWFKADAYCTWRGKRLPTEAEWEYAARGGLSGKRYPWGDMITGTDANYMNSGDIWDNDTSPVESYAPNGYGLYDMVGNVHEWVNDRYSAVYYSESPVNDPQGPVNGTETVLRGGSWDDNISNLRCAVRHRDNRDISFWNVGFRCAGD
jgi:formylglycine-generating enzyme required for sulfatase activity